MQTKIKITYWSLTDTKIHKIKFKLNEIKGSQKGQKVILP